jgi:hypothetical protein
MDDGMLVILEATHLQICLAATPGPEVLVVLSGFVPNMGMKR